jgi:hypothetical protein
VVTIKVLFLYLNKKEVEFIEKILKDKWIRKSELNNYNTLFAKRLLNAGIVVEQDLTEEEYKQFLKDKKKEKGEV